MKKTRFFLLLILCLASAGAHAQWTTEKITRLMDTLQTPFSQNPNGSLSTEMSAHLNQAIHWLQPPTDSQTTFLLSALLYFRSNDFIAQGNLAGAQKDIDAIKGYIVAPYQDSLFLDLLGSAWEMEHINFANFQFDFMRSKRAADTALICYEKCNNRLAVARTEANLSFLFANCGRCTEGLNRTRDAKTTYNTLSLAAKNQDPSFVLYLPYTTGVAWICMADSLRLVGESEAANAHYKNAIALYDAGLADYDRIDEAYKRPDIPAVFDFTIGRACLYAMPQDPVRAAVHLTRAVETFNALQNTYQEGLARVMLGWATVLNGQREDGLQHIVKGMNILGCTATTIEGASGLPKNAYNTFILGAFMIKAAALRYLHVTGHRDRDYLKQSLVDLETAGDILRDMQSRVGDSRDRASVELASGTFGQAFSYGAVVAAELYDSTKQPDYLSRALVMADQGKNFTLWNYLRQSTLNPNIGIPNDTVAKVPLALTQSLLDDSTALLEYVLVPNNRSLVIWVTRTEAGVHFFEPFPKWKRQAEAYADALQNLSDRNRPTTLDDFWKASVQLRAILLDQELLKKFKPSIKHFAIVRDNVLWRVNFDLLARQQLPDSGNYRYLIEDCATSYPYSLNALRLPYKEVLRQEGERGPGLEAFTANYGIQPVTCALGGKPLEDLPDMCDTASQVVKAWGKGAKLTPSATPEQFKANLRAADIALVVMHGCIAPEQSPMEYKLVFSQEQSLTVEDIYKIRPVQARLIFMGACNTAWGRLLRGEGQANISRAFAFLGCPTLVSAIERVYDTENAPIMKDFFEQFKKGHTAAYSLQQAKIAALKKGHSPERWGSLLCLGNGMVHISQGK
ncbi:MAG: CHAT domain-containing protein [Saprospiraceae bacterium]|nr:CHAT domain-containing protein [Saprospiraceae bacterium]